MINLNEIIKNDYPFLTNGVPELRAGFYEIKKYYILDNDRLVKTIYLDTDLGFFSSKSKRLIGSMYGVVGKIIDKAILHNETVLVEIINRPTNRGYMSLAFRLV